MNTSKMIETTNLLCDKLVAFDEMLEEYRSIMKGEFNTHLSYAATDPAITFEDRSLAAKLIADWDEIVVLVDFISTEIHLKTQDHDHLNTSQEAIDMLWDLLPRVVKLLIPTSVKQTFEHQLEQFLKSVYGEKS